MILSISAALIISGILLVALNKTRIPEIPIYIGSGLLLSFTASTLSSGLPGVSFETSIVRDLAFLGLGILVFYSTSGKVLDGNRSTALDSFKASIWLSLVSISAVTGLSMFAGFGLYESLLFGIVASTGSTLLNSKLVRDEARSNHIYGWLSEDMNFYDDLTGIIFLTALFSSYGGLKLVNGVVLSLFIVISALGLRGAFSRLMMAVTAGKDELILLLGVSIFISFVWLSEELGLTALAGIYAAGLIFVDTELGFRVRERFSAVKDFFTALSFFSLGYLVTLPPAKYMLMAVALTVFVLVLRPLMSTQFLRLQGYDLRTGFMASIQIAKVSEISVLGALLFLPVIGNPAFEAVIISFVAAILASHLIEDREHWIFERFFSDYELESEKTELPRRPENHVIIAGYDSKTQGLENAVDDRQVVVVDYDLQRIQDAEKRGIPHLLADLNSSQAWDEVNVGDAFAVVSAIEDEKTMKIMRDMELDGVKILAGEDSEEVNEELREMLEESLNEKEEV